jgi:hypothetical protein
VCARALVCVREREAGSLRTGGQWFDFRK